MGRNRTQVLAQRADEVDVPVDGLPACPHCGAILNTTVCVICGKTDRDDVQLVAKAPVQRGLTRTSKLQLTAFAVGFLALIGAGGFTYLQLTKQPERVEPTALAAPPSTTTPAITDAAARIVPMVHAGRNVLTGAAFASVDHQPGIDAVAAIANRGPAGFTLSGPEQAVWNDIDLVGAETTQPFAARSIVNDTATLADVWIIAGGDESGTDSAAYLELAQSILSPTNASTSIAVTADRDLHQLSNDGNRTLWVDIRDTWMLVYWAPDSTTTETLTAISAAWS
ncbi:MAG: hypothetical protein AAGA37_21155 [Actinomycetota bacterium]